MNKLITVLIGCFLMSVFVLSASAESITDPSGDVWHWNYTETKWGWDYDVTNKQNVDVTDISYSVSGNQVTLAMTVAGTITNSELVSYWAYLNTSDSSYMFSWMNNEAIGWGTNTIEGSFEMDFDPEITASGNTITATYDAVGTFANPEVWGWAAEYTSAGDVSAEWWADWVPNEESPYYDEYSGSDDTGDDNGADDTGGDNSGTEGSGNDDSEESNGEDSTTNTPPPSGTPGFELLSLIVALGVTFVLLRRKH